MKSSLKAISPFVLSGLVIAALGTFNGYSSKASASTGGFGLLVGNVRPCTAKQFDASRADPLIVILTQDAVTYDTYNISADVGTTSYHFDVPVGHYELITTWPKSRVIAIVVKFGKTSKVNVTVSCGPFVT